jgi:hypothetical protein
MRYAYVTRDALAKGGLVKIRIEPRPGSGVLVRDADSVRRLWYVLGIDAFEDLNEARTDARQRRDRKIKALQGQIVRLRKLEFEP